ncbi:hypothetical protein HHL22_14815 [Hymenobacter sp. RP-2-7]|uniref:Uncharacterized protein n=1 Tax=Hymenobacter polaris TaxID=2682546 RepID=A0A7Y0FNH7_9BACT|nr:hypothetical protein [Hymenobacter polaris]NML66479.1 hypothetical protein [Hymenobacter polaris]
MNRFTLFLTLGLALPLAAAAQTKPTQQVTEVTEELDPKTGKVIRRTTRTTTVPAGTVAAPSSTSTTSTTADVPVAPASDAVISDYFREKTVVSKLSASELLSAYSRFIEKVRADRQGWQTADWANAANVLSSLNGRYSQLRDSFSLDDKVTIRSQQAEFQALRTARQISKDVSDKL